MEIHIPKSLLQVARSIKMQNYKVNTPTKFHKFKNPLDMFTEQLNKKLESKVDWVLFSAANGAEAHTDKLDTDIYGTTTFIIPVILPSKGATLYHSEGIEQLELGKLYEINHQLLHSLDVHSLDGCVLVMASKIE